MASLKAPVYQATFFLDKMKQNPVHLTNAFGTNKAGLAVVSLLGKKLKKEDKLGGEGHHSRGSGGGILGRTSQSILKVRYQSDHLWQ